MTQRVDWTDYSKAIGISLVVYGHVARGLYNAGIEIPQGLYQIADSIVYSFHMPLFFFLSGIFFYDSFIKHGSIKLISRKIDTIVYPYIIWSIFQGCIEIFLSNYTNGNVTYSEVFSLLWHPRAHFWFFYALFTCFVFATLTFSLLPKQSAIGILILSAIFHIYPEIIPYTMVSAFISRHFVFFMLGVFFSFHFKIKWLSNIYALFFLTIVFVISQFLFHFTFNLHYTHKGIVTLLLSSVSIFYIISLSSWLSKKPKKVILLIGKSSIAIYVMHILTGSGIRIILKSFLGIDSFVFHLILGFTFGIIIPTIAFLLITKFKIPFLFYAPISNFIPGIPSQPVKKEHDEKQMESVTETEV